MQVEWSDLVNFVYCAHAHASEAFGIVMWFLVDNLRCWSLMALLGFRVFLQK